VAMTSVSDDKDLSLLNVVRHSRVTPVNTNLYKGTITKI